HRALHLPVVLPLQRGLAFLVLSLAPAQAELDLRDAVGEVDAHRDEREPLLLLLADQPLDLSAMQQQLPRAQRIVAALLALLVRRDVHVLEPQLAALDASVRLADRRAALPQGLDLRPGQDDAGLEALQDRV